MIPDHYDLYRAHEARQQRELERFPICQSCHEHITEDKACLLDGEWWHTDCFVDHFEACVDNYFDY